MLNFVFLNFFDKYQDAGLNPDGELVTDPSDPDPQHCLKYYSCVLLCREYDLLLPQPERVDEHGEDAAPVYTGSRRYPGKVFSNF
jgi:hypothetical protein